jgi:hypothetical protein
MTGEKFARSLMSPVPLDSLMFVVQGGMPADFILGLSVQVFEGRRNTGAYGKGFEPADPQFGRVLRLVGVLQRATVLETEVTRQGEHVELGVRFHASDPSNYGLAAELAELKSLLGVPDELDRLKVVFGNLAPEPDVIGIRTRSLVQILGVLGTGVQVQSEHLAEGLALPVDSSMAVPGFTVHSGEEEPDEAFVAVPYEGLWFWIDRRDLASKTTFAVVTMMFNFLEGGAGKASPVLTIPTN